MFFDNFFNDFEPFNAYSYRQPRTQRNFYQNDKHSLLLRNILNDEYNYICFDCHRETSDLDYFDLKNGIFLCYNCAQLHAKLSKEITHPMTGNIRSLEDNELSLLYYGGNKNLIEFIRRHYPLLENMNMKDMYSTKAMDYYRKLLRSKIYDEPEPEMPSKKKAYTSIFQKKVSPTREQNNKNLRSRKTLESRDNRDEDLNDIFSSTFFGDDLFNRNRQNQRRKATNDENKDENYLKTEPADIKKKEEEKIDDAGMKVEKRNNSHEKHYQKKQPKVKKVVKQEPKLKEEKKEEEKITTSNVLTINQIGDINRYPDALDIDGMECE